MIGEALEDRLGSVIGEALEDRSDPTVSEGLEGALFLERGIAQVGIMIASDSSKPHLRARCPTPALAPKPCSRAGLS